MPEDCCFSESSVIPEKLLPELLLLLLLLLLLDSLLPEDVVEPLPALGCLPELLDVELPPAELLSVELLEELLVVGLVVVIFSIFFALMI